MLPLTETGTRYLDCRCRVMAAVGVDEPAGDRVLPCDCRALDSANATVNVDGLVALNP